MYLPNIHHTTLVLYAPLQGSTPGQICRARMYIQQYFQIHAVHTGCVAIDEGRLQGQRQIFVCKHPKTLANRTEHKKAFLIPIKP
jgi:hypothetical protein